MSADVAAQREDACEIDLQHRVPVAVGELVRWVTLLDAAAVEQDVDSVAVAEDLGCELGDRVVGGEVCGVDCGFTTELLDGLLCLLVGVVALVLLVACSSAWWGLEMGVPGREGYLLLPQQGQWPLTDQFPLYLL